MRLFNNIIGELALVNPSLTNTLFTWSNFRKEPICCRLDRFLFTLDWEEVFKFSRQLAIVRAVSNRTHVVLDSNPPN